MTKSRMNRIKKMISLALLHRFDCILKTRSIVSPIVIRVQSTLLKMAFCNADIMLATALFRPDRTLTGCTMPACYLAPGAQEGAEKRERPVSVLSQTSPGRDCKTY